VANGLIVAAVAIGVARWLRRRWSVASPQLEREASRLLFSSVGRAELSRSLMIEVDAMLAGLRSIDEKILGMTVVAMLAEYDSADSSADRQSALLGMVSVLEKVEGRMAPVARPPPGRDHDHDRCRRVRRGRPQRRPTLTRLRSSQRQHATKSAVDLGAQCVRNLADPATQVVLVDGDQCGHVDDRVLG
jgi:hypothetical protein